MTPKPAAQTIAKIKISIWLSLDVVSKIRAFRQINPEIFFKHIRGAPKRRVELLYHENDSEAYWLANQIQYLLGGGFKGSGAGWNVDDPKGIPFTVGQERLASDLNKLLYGNINMGSGLAIVSQTVPKPGTEDGAAWQALINAICSGLGMPGLPVAMAVREDASVPQGTFIIVVGQKQ